VMAAPPVSALGSGSDYTAFLDHIGVSAIDMGLNGAGGGGTYHSIYDDPIWFKKFIDPDFKFSLLATRITGVALLRLVDADVLPFDYEAYGKQIREYVDEIQKEAEKKSKDEAARVGFDRLRAAADAFAQAGAGLRARTDTLLGGTPDRKVLAAVDAKLVGAERDLIEAEGLPDRPWYRHTIYAPGLYTGYGVKTIPGVREAIDAGDFERASAQARIVVRALERATKTLKGE
jgi:N-acetylated-alpha-linked acidic dipeptidase